MPFNEPDSLAFFKAVLISSTVTVFPTSKTQSVMDPFSRGTRMASPLSLPLSSGYTRVTAVAEPVDVGARLHRPDLPLLKSDFLEFGASTMVCVFVTLWTVVMHPFTMPKFSWITFTTGARQLVVQDAAVMRWSFFGSYFSSLHPYTMFSTSSFTGAETMTFFTPASK
eukprot:scaffold660_cov365-Pavlova_lutheri.AAC.5